ncbi:MAG: divergent polysaccharide deacetylase family protein [Devosia sp.]|uniref:divergent polysaccharide deacetylase family protein n=1 Tax=Devosia sp. TaxID=1871048 RepID=UPI002631C943|nr:divergent polysaccharide deacetylase family protein [Devosia sp.]MDB5539051.1 divergent polysaccharide deacetylase family protein [Devosia sp.]
MTDLSAPLVSRKARKARAANAGAATPRRHVPVTRIAIGLLALIALGATARIMLVDDPEGGRPSATVDIASAAGSNSVAGTVAPGPVSITADPEMFPAEMTDIPAEQDPPFADPTAIDPDLVEETEFGPIPRMSATGETPFAAYSRPSDTPATAGGKPLVAIVVSGLGLNLEGTLEAIDKLPEDVTLAFAPYGKTLDRTVGAARAEGHEIFLEVPLEPFDYPENDPGPDTLLTGQAPRDNLGKLFSVMGRFSGYVGLINNMGARFTASGADFGPMMEELGARGLGYLDDGSSNRSLAPQLAGANRVPFGRVDMMIDANPARGPILAALAALEKQARANGSAIGIVSALPVSVEAVSEWAAGLAEKGIEIVPASALMGGK